MALRSNLAQADLALEGIYRLNTAREVEDVRAAAALIRHVAQNLIYAHRDGRTGWQVTGALPKRTAGDGSFPVRGWLSGDPWDGYVPAVENPGGEGPDRDGVLVIANHRTVPRQHPVRVSNGWMPPYRAQRIEELLAEQERWRPQDMGRLLLDRHGLEPRRYQRALAGLEPQLSAFDPFAWELARSLLMSWDGSFAGASASAAFFVALRPALFEALFADELGEEAAELAALSPLSYNALQEVVFSGRSSFWDDLRTPEVETPAHIWARALRQASAELGQQQGADPSGWRLDRLRFIEFPHAFSRVPLLGRQFGAGPLAIGGDDHTVNVSKSSLLDPARVAFTVSYRVVMTPGDWSATAGTNTLGQSGHRFSPYRADQLPDWLEGRLRPWSWGGPPPEQVVGQLRLLPPAP